MKRAAGITGLVWAIFGATAVGAGPYDGVYVAYPDRGAPDLSRCASLEVLITAGTVSYFAVSCNLTNPVPVRGMDALLYDGQCKLDNIDRSGRVLIRRMASGDVTLVTPFMDLRLSSCDVAG